MQESNQLLLAVSSSFYWKAQNNLQQIQKAKEWSDTAETYWSHYPEFTKQKQTFDSQIF